MSEREGLSIIAIESLTLGTPVLLPNYSPIPKEVKDMCIVENEKRIPSMIVRMMDGDKNAFLRSDSKINRFYISNIPRTYGKLFRLLGIA